MKTFIVVILIAAMAAAAFGAAYRTITPADAKGLLAKKRKVFLLDVRTPDEYRQAHLRGARLIPLDALERRVTEIPRNVPVLVYCAVGSRSLAAAGFLAGKGYREVYNMSDGIVGWYRQGFPIER